MVCGHLENETTAAVQRAAFSDVSVVTFPGCCFPPYASWDPLLQAVRDVEWHCGQVCILGGHCVSRLDAVPEEAENCRLLRMESCSEALVGPSLLEGLLREGDRVLTPGELFFFRQQEIVHPLDDGALRRQFGESTTRLLLVDTAIDSRVPQYLGTLADRLGVPYTIVTVGLDFYCLFLEKLVLEWRLQKERSDSRAALSDAIRRSTDHATALDLISNLTQMMTETEAIDHILDLFTILFAPSRLVYLPLVNGQPGHIRSNPESVRTDEGMIRRLAGFREDYAWIEGRKGFLLRISRQDETLGVLETEGIAFPKHRDHYLSLSLVVARVCGLAIANARAYERRREAEEIIRHQAFHDTLTGLPNRTLFHTRLTQALDDAQRNRENLAVLFLDLDDFKQINDTLGHDKGDDLLSSVAERLKGVVRSHDTVARLGGDEFLVLLPGIASPNDAAKVAKRALDTVGAPFVLDGENAQVTSSIGIAIYPQDGQKAETLIKNADAAMYDAKQAGPGGYAFFSPELSAPPEITLGGSDSPDESEPPAGNG